MISLGQAAQIACLWEATARKPGNVHRFRDFDDATYPDFLLSAVALGEVFNDAPLMPVGPLVFEAVHQTQRFVRSNTNLGIILLLAPLAIATRYPDCRSGVNDVLTALDQADARDVYAAIRLANPSGLGRVEDQDISEEPTLPLRDVMALAADRDLVARQYANGFREVFDEGAPALVRGLEVTGCLEGAIIFCHLSLMAAHPDSLIARKRGSAEAEESARRARAVLDASWPSAPAGVEALTQLDDWLRAVGRGRNPGTTADLVTASLFVTLREQIITLPPAYPWTLDRPSDMKNPSLPPPGRP
jgi:triphosphoribosyl-dephospho-CoA synthase